MHTLESPGVTPLAEGGWNDVRSWRSLDGDLRVDAVFLPRGYVRMTWRVSP